MILVEEKLKKLTLRQIIDLMDTCLPDELETEQDMAKLIAMLWPRLLEIQSND